MMDTPPGAEPAWLKWARRLLGIFALAGLLVWWPMLVAGAPAWPRYLSPALSTASAILWTILSWRYSHALRRALLLAVLIACAAALARDAGLQRHGRAPRGHTVRVMQWHLDPASTNMAVLSELERELPHVALIYGAPSWVYERAARRGGIREARLRFRVASEHALVLSRYPMERLDVPPHRATEWVLCRVYEPRGPFYVLGVNAPHRSYTALDVQEIEEWTRGLRPLILAVRGGRDRTDAAWRPIRTSMAPAFERGGVGWPYDAPKCFPVYAMNNLWVSEEFGVYRSGYRWSRHSPHVRHVAILRHPNEANP